MKLSALIASVTLAVAAVLGSPAAKAVTYSFEDHGSSEVSQVVSGGVVSNGSFADVYSFSLSSQSLVTSTAVTANVSSVFRIVGGVYQLFSGLYGSGTETLVGGGWTFDGTSGDTPNSLPLDAGNYFYLVTGTATGSAGGVYSLVSTAKAMAVATAVPEPETYALWLSGLCVVGFVVMRRRRS